MTGTLRIAALAICASCVSQTPAGKGTGAAPAKAPPKLPDFTLETVEGDRFTLSDHVGKSVIVLSFWATWCAPCLEELPHLQKLYEAEKANGLVIVALSMDEPTTVAEVAPTARRLGLTMPVALDTEQRAVRLYNRSRDAPMTVVINRAGQIVKSHAGYNPGDEVALADELRALLR